MSRRIVWTFISGHRASVRRRPAGAPLERTLKSLDAEHRARFLCEGLARIAALAPLVEAKSDFAPLYGDARLTDIHFSQFNTADLGNAEQRAFET